MKGLIFSVKRYAIHDGPGIRVTFFMKGCPLSCWWCHNPEGILPEPEEIMQVNRIGEREFRKKEVVGKYYSAEDILSILERERIFIEKSNGGVTFSGGEPVMQSEFLAEALDACKKAGYHTVVDTSGHFPPSSLDIILPGTDMFLFDIKHLSPERHSEYTGVSNKTILENLSRILETGKEVMLRIPVIPGINDDDPHLEMIKKFISGIEAVNLKRIDLLPFHKTGASKYTRFNRPYRMGHFNQPSQQRMKELKDYFSSTGIQVKIGG